MADEMSKKKLTPKQRVLRRYPMAFVRKHPDWEIYQCWKRPQDGSDYELALADGLSAESVWRAAAEKLK